jgi:hypothetical protein
MTSKLCSGCGLFQMGKHSDGLRDFFDIDFAIAHG